MGRLGDQHEPAETTPTEPKQLLTPQNNEATIEMNFRDERLPCAQHLDPSGTLLPTSSWIHIQNVLPTTLLEEVVESLEQVLREEIQTGVVDLDADWNPVSEQVPLLLPPPSSSSSSLVEAAHVVLSPFGRPNGWYVKVSNRSLVHALLTREKYLQIAWKVVQVSEHVYQPPTRETDWAMANRLGILDDSVVRLENCPRRVSIDYVRHLVGRFEVRSFEGIRTSIVVWKGRTPDGRKPPPMYVIRFASAAWARAAVRELQSSRIGENGEKPLRWIPYPKQKIWNEKGGE